MFDVTCVNKTVQEQLNCGLFSLTLTWHKREFNSYRLHKPVTNWLETLPPQYIRTEYVRESLIGHN